jgi:molybdopterin converting factor small subunit
VNVQVQYRAQFRAAAGVMTDDMTLASSATVLDALRHVIVLRPALRALLFDAADALRPSTLVFKNDQPVPVVVVATTALAEGDQLLLLAPMAGG